GNIEIDMIRPDLGARVSLASVQGTFIAGMGRTRADRFATVGDANGLTGIRFDNAWQQAGTQSLNASGVLSMSSTRYFDDTLVAWSTESTCTLDRVAAGRVSTRDFTCLDSHVA